MGDLYLMILRVVTFLGQVSNKTNYNWYIKDHPNYSGKYKKYQPFTKNITKEICKKFPKIKEFHLALLIIN